MADELGRLGRGQLVEMVEKLRLPRRVYLKDGGLDGCVVIGCDRPAFAMWVTGGDAAPYCATHDAVLTRRHAAGHEEVDLLDSSDIEEGRE